MMSIPKACVEAAGRKEHWTDNRKDIAHRVILALAEEMPEDAVEKAQAAFFEHWADGRNRTHQGSLRDAIAAFLTHVAGDSP